MKNSKRELLVKQLFPNYYANFKGFYNFTHEIRRTQKHLFFACWKEFVFQYVYMGANEMPPSIEAMVQERKQTVDRLKAYEGTDATSRAVLVASEEKLLAQVQEAKQFISEFLAGSPKVKQLAAKYQ